MALSGFDPALVNASITKVKAAYAELMTALVGDTQSKFVNPMAQAWACNDAITFFTSNFEPAITEQATSATTIFQSVVEAMNSAAQAWAASTDTSYSPVSFDADTRKVDVSGISENIGGVRGIDLASSTSIVTSLEGVKASVSSALSNAKNAVSNCGFVGGAQEANLNASLSQIQTNVNNAIAELTGAVNTAITNTVDSYGDTQGRIEQAFTA